MPRLPLLSSITALSCSRCVNLLSGFLDEELDGWTTDQIRAHLADCGGCSVYLDQLRTVVGALAALPPPSTPQPSKALIRVFREWSYSSAVRSD